MFNSFFSFISHKISFFSSGILFNFSSFFISKSSFFSNSQFHKITSSIISNGLKKSFKFNQFFLRFLYFSSFLKIFSSKLSFSFKISLP